MASEDPTPQTNYFAKFLPSAFTKQSSLPSPMTNRGSTANEGASHQDSTDLTHPENMSPRLVQTLPAQNAADVDENASETSEGSSIDFDAPPGRNKTISGTRDHPSHHFTTASLGTDHPDIQTHTGEASHDALVRLDSQSLIPPPLRDVIDQWCASKGPGYSLSQLPCLTTADPRQVSQSSKGKPATWEYKDGKPMMAKMYALTGTNVKQGQRKILVVQGIKDMLGPFIVSYANQASTSNRVAFKIWTGLSGDNDGFEKGYSVAKVISSQTQVPPVKRRDNLPRLTSRDTTVVTTNLDYNTLRLHKRKRRTDDADDLGIFTNHADSVPEMLATGVRTSTALNSRMIKGEDSQTSRPPIFHVASRTAGPEDQMWHNLGSLPGGSFEEPNVERHTAEPRASTRRTSRSHTNTESGLSTSVTVVGSPNKHMPSAVKDMSLLAQTFAHRKPTQNAAPFGYPPTVAPRYKASQKEEVFDLHLNSAARPHGEIKDPVGLIARESSLQELISGEQITERGVELAERTPLTLPSSSKRATVVNNPYQLEEKSKDVDHKVEAKTWAAADQIPAPTVHAQKPNQPADPATSARLPHMYSSTEDGHNGASLRGSSAKLRRKLKLQHVFFKFNSALPHEPPRVRPFTACDTTQKLFHQARTGDVFGKASEVRPGGKLLTVEFRGSGRLPDEVYLINEDDDEDFLKMRSALLRKDWWTSVDDNIVGGGILDVRDAQ